MTIHAILPYSCAVSPPLASAAALNVCAKCTIAPMRPIVPMRNQNHFTVVTTETEPMYMEKTITTAGKNQVSNLEDKLARGLTRKCEADRDDDKERHKAQVGQKLDGSDRCE